MRKLNAHRPHRERVSNQSRYSTPDEVRHARLALAHEMVDLVLSETDTLPQTMQRRLEGLAKMLDDVMQQARGRR